MYFKYFWIFQPLSVVAAVSGVRARGLLQIEMQIQVGCILSWGWQNILFSSVFSVTLLSGFFCLLTLGFPRRDQDSRGMQSRGMLWIFDKWRVSEWVSGGTVSGEKFQLQGCLGNGKHAEFIFIFGGKKGKKNRELFAFYQMVSSRNNWRDWWLVKINLPHDMLIVWEDWGLSGV